jgi:hypothetical protein
MAIAVYPPPGPREEKRTALEYVLGALLLLAIAGLVVAAVWVIASGRLP